MTWPTGSAQVVHGDARNLDFLDDETVDLIVTSPPYFALRSYRDGDEHYDGQIGSEATPDDFIDALTACMDEWRRLLKPSGSVWVNLGDKYAGSGGHNNSSIGADPDRGPSAYNKAGGTARPKSLLGLPWRFAIRQIDNGWILRAEVIWSKPNGLPESVTDRVRRSHEQWFHFTKEPRYFSAVDEVREAQKTPERQGRVNGYAVTGKTDGVSRDRGWNAGLLEYNPLGRLPGSVWEIPTEPLIIPDAIRESRNLPDHFAAFPQEWPRRIIEGWSPKGICQECGEGVRPVVDVLTGETTEVRDLTPSEIRKWVDAFIDLCAELGISGSDLHHATGTKSMASHCLTKGQQPEVPTPEHWQSMLEHLPQLASCEKWMHEFVHKTKTVPIRAMRPRQLDGTIEQYSFDSRFNPAHQSITAYACNCPTPGTLTPAVILDPFGGTGTVAGVARALGRHGISVDLSRDYCRLAEWRIFESGHFDKAIQRTMADKQGRLL